MRVRELSESEYLQTFGEPMRKLEAGVEPPFDFWPYFEAIPEADFAAHNCADGMVDIVYQDPSGRFEHVLVNSEDKNVFMVLVLDRRAGTVHGHRLLDLNRLYGVQPNTSFERTREE